MGNQSIILSLALSLANPWETVTITTFAVLTCHLGFSIPSLPCGACTPKVRVGLAQYFSSYWLPFLAAAVAAVVYPLCAPIDAVAHQGFAYPGSLWQEYWSGLLSPMQESEK